MVNSHQPSNHGMKSRSKTFPRHGTGEMLMELTIFPGTRTSTSHNTADHAGLRVPLHPLLIDLTSSWETRTQLQLLLMLKSLSTLTLEATVRVETPLVLTPTPKKYGIPDSSCEQYVAKDLETTFDAMTRCKDCTWPPCPVGQDCQDKCWAVKHKAYFVDKYFSVRGASRMKAEISKNGPIGCGI